MARSDAVRRMALGASGLDWPRQALGGAIAFVVTFVGYAIGIFAAGGGVVFVPIHAAAVGMGLAAALGYGRGGLPFAWLSVYGAYLGFHADWAAFGLSSRPVADRLAFLLAPDAHGYFLVSAVVFGSVAFIVGRGLGALLASEVWRRTTG